MASNTSTADNTEQTHVTEISEADVTLLEITFEKSNTKKSTQWAITTWNNWRGDNGEDTGSKGYKPTLTQLMEMTKPEIDAQMARFVLDLKRLGGEDYPIDSIKGIVFGMQRYAKAYGSYHKKEPLNIIGNDYDFPKFNKAFRDKKKALKEELYRGNLDRKRAQGISIAQEEALWDMGIFGCHSARALSDTVFFYVTKIFGFISGTSLRLLKIEHFKFSEDKYGKYVDLDKNFSKEELSEQLYNRCHGIEVPSGALRHYCNPSNPRTFYNILKFYIEKLTEYKRPDTYLFTTPKEDMKFASTPIGKNMLQQKFTKIMKAAEVEGYYTNQSLVQSIGPRLQAKGYNVKKQHVFQPLDHLEICKILDPPPGLVNTADIQSQTKAILQLVSVPTGGTTAFKQMVSPGNAIHNQIPFVFQQPNATFQFTSGTPTLAVSMSNPVPQTLCVPSLQNQSFFIQQGFNPQSSAPFQLVSSPTTQTTGNAQLSIQQGPDDKFQLTLKSVSDGSLASSSQSVGTFLPNQVIPTTMQNNPHSYSSRSSEKFKNPTVTTEMENTENMDSDSNAAYPLFLNKAESSEGEHGNFYDANEPCNIIIKQEPVDYNGDYEETYQHSEHNKVVLSGNRNTSEADDNSKGHKESPERGSDVAKRKQREEISRDRDISDKRMKLEESQNESVDSEKEEHIAEIEYSFKNDLNKKSVKQEVSVNDDEQTVFSFSGTNKMGKTMNDLDLNLGDYLPENCVIRPGDIDLKRIITADGGKMVIRVKYSMDSKDE